MTIADAAQVSYTEQQIRLDDEARAMAAAGAALTSGMFRNYARIAYRAAKAEQTNPDPDPMRPCHICCGVRTCDWTSHQQRFDR